MVRDEPAPPRKHRPDLDAALEQVCLKAMAKKAADRYAGMEELAADLKAYLDGAPAKRKPRRRLRVAVLAGVTCAGLALAAGLDVAAARRVARPRAPMHPVLRRRPRRTSQRIPGSFRRTCSGPYSKT